MARRAIGTTSTTPGEHSGVATSASSANVVLEVDLAAMTSMSQVRDRVNVLLAQFATMIPK